MTDKGFRQRPHTTLLPSFVRCSTNRTSLDHYFQDNNNALCAHSSHIDPEVEAHLGNKERTLSLYERRDTNVTSKLNPCSSNIYALVQNKRQDCKSSNYYGALTTPHQRLEKVPIRRELDGSLTPILDSRGEGALKSHSRAFVTPTRVLEPDRVSEDTLNS